MDPWVWAILLLVLGLGLAILEVFFPSAGILGFLSFSAILAAIFMGFQQEGHTWVGFVILGVALVGLPALVVGALKVWPKTAMGRRVLLMAPSSDDVLPEDPRRERLKGFIGQVARAKCKMLPGGAITIDGLTVDAVSEGMPIEAGQPVRVIEVRGRRAVVRPLSAEEPSEDAEDPLMRPFESPFDDSPG
ncbi:MAG: NfeD family protein [Pirellulales bacterium]|nr:NfeD family protein [Pirellulales bacterium]